MDIVVQVTEDHIRRGTPGSPLQCPIALAVKDALGLPLTVNTTHITADGLEAWLPTKVTDRILLFDQGRGMEPFELVLELRRR